MKDRGAAQPVQGTGQPPATNSDPASDVNSAEAEKSWVGGMRGNLHKEVLPNLPSA